MGVRARWAKLRFDEDIFTLYLWCRVDAPGGVSALVVLGDERVMAVSFFIEGGVWATLYLLVPLCRRIWFSAKINMGHFAVDNVDTVDKADAERVRGGSGG